MDLKNENKIKQVFINLTHTRGLLWPNIVEGILFDDHGFPRDASNKVEIDESSLSTILSVNNTSEVVNYILVLDYLVDFFKNEYDLGNIEIATLLQKYLIENNLTKFENLQDPVGSWIIPTKLIISNNQKLFENSISQIFIWIMSTHIKTWEPSHIFFKKQISSEQDKTYITEMMFHFIKIKDKKEIKELLSFSNRENDELWHNFIKEFKQFIDEKKNSPTSS